MPEDVWGVNADVRFMVCFNQFALGKHWGLPLTLSVYRLVLDYWWRCDEHAHASSVSGSVVILGVGGGWVDGLLWCDVVMQKKEGEGDGGKGVMVCT